MNIENMRQHAQKIGSVLKLDPGGETTCSSSQTAFMLLEALAIAIARDNRFVRVPTPSGAVVQFCEQRGGDRMIIIMQLPNGFASLLSQGLKEFRQTEPDLFATYRRAADEIRQSDLLKSGVFASAVGGRVDIVRPEFHFADHEHASMFLVALAALLPDPMKPGSMQLAESDERRAAWRKLGDNAYIVMLCHRKNGDAWLGTMTRTELRQVLPDDVEPDSDGTETLH